MEKTFDQKLSAAALRFRVMAWVTGVVLATATVWLVIGRLFLDYGNPGDRPALYGYLWIAHGWLYFLYLITGVDLSFRMRYGIGKTVLILLAGTVPFMSFFADNVTHKDVQARIAADRALEAEL